LERELSFFGPGICLSIELPLCHSLVRFVILLCIVQATKQAMQGDTRAAKEIKVSHI